MTSVRGKRALIVGGSAGIGRATVAALLREGARVTAVARDIDRLRAMAPTQGDALTIRAGDAADPGFLVPLMQELRPELVVVTAGVNPVMGRVDELDWDTFSQAWNVDTKVSFHVVQSALRQPLAPGATVVLVSSGAAVNGSPLSGGYAGAKRMQWWLASYAQRASDTAGLGLRVLAVVPEQLVTGTAIGTRAATVYGAMNQMTAEAFMQRYPVQLDTEKVADAILAALGGEVPTGVDAISVKGTGFGPVP